MKVEGGGLRFQGSELNPLGMGLRVEGARCVVRVHGSEFMVHGSWFRAQGSGFRVQGSGFRV